jgi:hypothetical protein
MYLVAAHYTFNSRDGLFRLERISEQEHLLSLLALSSYYLLAYSSRPSLIFSPISANSSW